MMNYQDDHAQTPGRKQRSLMEEEHFLRATFGLLTLAMVAALLKATDYAAGNLWHSGWLEEKGLT